MSSSVFGEKAAVPNEEMLADVLRDSGRLWDDLKKHMMSAYEDVVLEWKFYGKSSGWTLACKSNKRTLLYLTPLDGRFKITFVLGEKAAAKAQAADFPEYLLQSISEAKPYAEGRSFPVDVKSGSDLELVKSLLKIKAEN